MDSTPQRTLSSWDRFWFTPRDPSVLALIRIFCGAITLYTMVAYSFTLQDFFGADAWYDLEARARYYRERAMQVAALSGRETPAAVPTTEEEKKYVKSYWQKFGAMPPAPFPENARQVEFIDTYRKTYGNDPRRFGLPLPRDDKEFAYILRYTMHDANILRLPPAAYSSYREEEAIYEYMKKHGGQPPHLNYAQGSPIWSLWFHVTDPTWMAIWHGVVCFVIFLFTIGFCTRLTSALTWMGALWYVHRNQVILFGVDTMMVILLLYLMIGSSGGAYSVDRLIARWWSVNKPRVINAWRRLFRMAPLEPHQIAPAHYSTTPEPTVSTNVAIRLLQIHVCIIYLASGLTKLQGNAWWGGTAVWGTIANFEFAPMQFEIYNRILHALGTYDWMFELFLNVAGFFTLAFEIGYAFLIYRPSLRWVFLGGAILLHGGIGLFMGLKTFSLMMLVMNMAFLKTEEVQAMLRWVGVGRRPSKPEPAVVPSRV